MVFEHIEKLKKQYTDKYVVVNDQVPELRRFRGQTGIVKTVNMSGRALVQFDAYDNIGWIDIDVDFIKVIDQPLPKAEPKAKTKAAPTSKAEAKPASSTPVKEKPPTSASTVVSGSAKPNMADILAAARANKGSSPATPSAPATKEKALTKESASAKTTSAPTPTASAKVDPKGMSMADILAAARGNKGTPDTAPAAASAPKLTPVAKATATAEPKESATPAPAPKAVTSKGSLPTTTADIVAYCRKNDAKS